MATRLAPGQISDLDPYKFMGAARPAHVRKMAWLMPRMGKAVPYLGYIIIAGIRPA